MCFAHFCSHIRKLFLTSETKQFPYTFVSISLPAISNRMIRTCNRPRNKGKTWWFQKSIFCILFQEFFEADVILWRWPLHPCGLRIIPRRLDFQWRFRDVWKSQWIKQITYRSVIRSWVTSFVFHAAHVCWNRWSSTPNLIRRSFSFYRPPTFFPLDVSFSDLNYRCTSFAV